MRVHLAADGGLARVRTPGGILTGRQWQAVIAAAAELGNGQLELTSRGNLQLRGLAAGDEVPLAARLQDAGLLPSLTHERVRNLLASPLTGRDGGLLDVRPLVAEFDRALCARPALAELSGRFLFALDDGRADVLAAEPDIAVTATSPSSMRLVLAGQPVPGQHPSSDAVELMLAAAEAFLAERQVQGGTAWRLAELTDGPARVAARLGIANPDYAAGSSPNAGSTLDSRPALDSRPVLDSRPALDPRPALDSRPALEPRPAVRSGSAAAHGLGQAAALVPGRPIRQRDGASALVIGIPLGSLNIEQAEAFIRPELILTPWRSIVLPDLTAEDVTELLAVSARLGMIIDGSDPLRGVTSCTGRPGCASALADVRADALATHRVAAVPADALPTTGVHWSGCSRRCGRPAGTATDLVATGAGYRLSSNDRTVEAGSTPAELATALAGTPAQAGTSAQATTSAQAHPTLAVAR